MTIEMSGLVAAQSRIAHLQSRLTLTGSTSGGTSTATTGSFDSSLRTALAKQSRTASAAAPFVYDPGAPPTNVTFKPGAAQALAATPATTATPSISAPVVAPTTTAHAPTTANTVNPVTATARATATHRTTATTAAAAVSKTSATTRVAEVVADAKKYLGTPYLWGGTNPAKGLDCSGFTQLVFKQNGITLPRVARDQQKMGTRVPSLDKARPGDLITFGKPAHHIGIYLGDNTFIHAPHTGDVVKISKVYATPSSIRRVLPDSAWNAAAATASTGSAARTAATVTARTAGATAAGHVAATPATTHTTAATSISSAAAPSTGGWAGAPAADTWGAASAEAATLGVAGVVSASPAAATGVTGSTSNTADPVVAVAATRRTTRTLTTPRTLAGASANGAVLAQAPAKYQTLFTQAGAKYGVSPDLLAAVAKQESGFKATAVSRAGARGLMQLMPGTARALGVRNSFDPAQAVDGAARLLRDHLKTFKGSTELALAAYNAGAGSVRRYDGIPPYRETQNYVRKIMTNLRAGAA